MEVKEPEIWLGGKDFEKSNPVRAVVTDLTQGQNKWGKAEYQLWLKMEDQSIKKTSLYGVNLKSCMDKWGKDSETWKGKGVVIWQIEDLNHKPVRQVNPA